MLTAYCTFIVPCLNFVSHSVSLFPTIHFSMLGYFCSPAFIDQLLPIIIIIVSLLFIIFILEMHSRYFDPVNMRYQQVNKHHKSQDSPTSVFV
jgi:uncharacterized membrane protein